MINLAIFASGSGTNAENIITHFKNHPSIKVAIILSNKPDAYVIQRAKNHAIPHYIFNKEQLNNTDLIYRVLDDHEIDFIILAGFLLKIPKKMIDRYPGRIINIHPALLPKYGGKGMYGMNVHKAVIEAAEKESGITIHLVDEKYDNGEILFQARCPITPDDTPETLADKIHQLEQDNFPRVIEEFSVLGTLPQRSRHCEEL